MMNLGQKLGQSTEKIIKLINKDVIEKDKEFILVSLSNPIQVYPSITYLKDYKKKII